MAYVVVYKDRVIGYSELEYSLGLAHIVSGAFRATPDFAAVEEELRPYARAIGELGPDGECTWRDRTGSPLPAMHIEIRDESGRPLSVSGASLFWPGDLPGWKFLGVRAIMTPRTPDPEPD